MTDAPQTTQILPPAGEPAAQSSGVTWRDVALGAMALVVTLTSILVMAIGLPLAVKMSQTQQRLVTSQELTNAEMLRLRTDVNDNDSSIGKHHDDILMLKKDVEALKDAGG